MTNHERWRRNIAGNLGAQDTMNGEKTRCTQSWIASVLSMGSVAASGFHDLVLLTGCLQLVIEHF